MSYSFSHLFSTYARRLERYFSSVTALDYDLDDFANSFHEVLIAALTDYGDTMSDSSFSVGELSGKQVSHMVTQLIKAETEAAAEQELQERVRRHFFPAFGNVLSLDDCQDLPKEVLDAIKGSCPPE